MMKENSTLIPGFPAHAGMDPAVHRHDRRTTNVTGFPAHAGMDPLPETQDANDTWFPRPRGDGPANGPRPLVAELGFPAHAGMDLYSRT